MTAEISHSVTATPFCVPGGVIAIKVIGKCNVEVALVSGIRLVLELAIESLTLLDCEHIS